MDKIDSSTPELNQKQKELYKQLNGIGNEIASFYHDGIKILSNSELETKSNLLAHIAREIDGGLRDIFAGKKKNLNEEKVIPKEEIQKIKEQINAELKAKGLSGIDNINGMVLSICNSLNLEKDLDLIINWSIISAQLVKFTHRRGAFKNPRDISLFTDIWERYENILFKLIGNYYNLLSRVDILLEKETPTEEIIKTLPNLFKTKALEQYFFTHLDKPNWLKPLKDAGFFNPENNPSRIKSQDDQSYRYPYWNALNYIEKIIKKVEGNTEINSIVEIVDSVIDYKENEKRIENFGTDYKIFKIISNLPSAEITKKHILFINEILVSNSNNILISSDIGKLFIHKLIKDNQKERLVELIDIITEFRVNEKSKYDKVSSLIEEYWFAEIIKKNSIAISDYCPLEVSELIIKRMYIIKKKDKNSFNIVCIPIIRNNPQNNFSDKYEAQLVKLLVVCLNKIDVDKLKGIIDLLIKKGEIFKRIAIYTINLKFNDLNYILWQLQDNPLDDYELKHEFYELLKDNTAILTDSQIEQVIKWIEEKDYFLPNDFKTDEEKEKFLAYKKKEWYHTLLESGNLKIESKYKEYNEKNDSPIEHPGFNIWSESWCGEISPLQEIELSSMSVDKIIKELTNFKEVQGMKRPTKQGLADVFEKVISQYPAKFSKNMDSFEKVPTIYLYSLIRGFTLAWQNKKSFDWKNVLDFIKNILGTTDFWEETFDNTFNYRNWFISEVTNLIEEGTKADENSFDKSLLPITKEILLILTKHEIYSKPTTEDYVSHTLNSVEGKLLHSMMNYSLRKYRIKDNKIFDEDIKKYFEEKINERKFPEIYTLLGQYLPQFNTLDAQWIKNNFNKIFSKENEKLFCPAIAGYMFNPTVYKIFYLLMKKNDQYVKLIENWDNNTNQINEDLTRHLCLGFVEGWETIDEKHSLISQLLKNKESFTEVIRFFWVFRKKIKNEHKPKIKELWKYIFETTKEDNNYKDISGKLLEWLNIFDYIDEDMFGWVKKGAKTIKHSDTLFLIDHLLNFAEEQPNEIGQIYLIVVSNIDILPTYKKEDIQRLIEMLYSKKEKILADQICIKYGENNIHFLRDIYDKYQ